MSRTYGGDDLFGIFVMGIFVGLCIWIYIHHTEESQCQQKHNVADCKVIFVPVERGEDDG